MFQQAAPPAAPPGRQNQVSSPDSCCHGLDGVANVRSQVYSFVPIPGAQQTKRPRRRWEDIERMYLCNHPLPGGGNCQKAYGTLNHLNAHVQMQHHGPKRTPEGMCSRIPPGLDAHTILSMSAPQEMLTIVGRVQGNPQGVEGSQEGGGYQAQASRRGSTKCPGRGPASSRYRAQPGSSAISSKSTSPPSDGVPASTIFRPDLDARLWRQQRLRALSVSPGRPGRSGCPSQPSHVSSS